MKNPEMLKFVLDQLKTKKVCEQEIKKLPIYYDMFVNNKRHNKCVIKLLQKMVEH